MLLINFLCIFYSMVLIRCDTISKNAINSKSNNVIYSRRETADAYSGTLGPRSERKQRLFKIPFLVTTPPLEKASYKLKQQKLQHTANWPYGTPGMFVTKPGYSTFTQNDHTVRPEILSRETDEYTTTEFDGTEYLDIFRLRSKKKERNGEPKAEKEQKKKPVKKKFKLKDSFKHHFSKKGKLPKNKVETGFERKENTKSTSTTLETHKTRQRRRATLLNILRRDPPKPESRIYNTLTNKLYYKAFVDGFKHYLDFEREMANSNFSDAVLYEAHKHHNVDDIGKFILEKLPKLPETETLIQLARLCKDPDLVSDVLGNKYEEIQTTAFTTSNPTVIEKRFIDIQRPTWLSKMSKRSYFVSKKNSRKRRRFDHSKLSHSLKTKPSKSKQTTKNVAFAKVNIVETSKTKSPFKNFFFKFKKHKSKRDAQKAGNSFLDKIKQIFSKNMKPIDKPKPVTARFQAYQGTNVFDTNLKYPIYKNPEINGLDELIEKYEKPVFESHPTQFSNLNDYEPNPKDAIFNSKIPTSYNPDSYVPFELTTPRVADLGLRNELHILQQQHDSMTAKPFEPNYEVNTETMDQPVLETKMFGSKESVTPGVQKTEKQPNADAIANLETYDKVRDLLRVINEQGQSSSTGLYQTAKPHRTLAQNPISSWQTKPVLANSMQDFELNLEDPSILTSPYGTPDEIIHENPSDRYNIKPDMPNEFQLIQPPKATTRKESDYENNKNIMIQASTMQILNRKESVEENYSNAYNDDYGKENAFNLFKYEKGKPESYTEAKHSIYEKPRHNKLMDNRYPSKNATSGMVPHAKKLTNLPHTNRPPGQFKQYEAPKNHINKVASQQKFKVNALTRPPYILPNPWGQDGPAKQDDIIQYSNIPNKKAKINNAKSSTGNINNKVDVEYSEFDATVTKRPSSSHSMRYDLDEYSKSVSRLLEDWKRKQSFNHRTTTRSLSKDYEDDANMISIKGSKSVKKGKAKINKDNKKPVKENGPPCSGKITYDNQHTLTPDEGAAQKVAHVGSVLKHWFSSTMKAMTKKLQYGVDVRDVTLNLWDDKDNNFLANTRPAKKNKDITLRTFNFDNVATDAIDSEKLYYTDRPATEQKHLFDILPNSDSVESKGYDQLFNYANSSVPKNRDFPPAAKTIDNRDYISKESDSNPSPDVAQTGQKSPDNLQILHVNDVTYAGYGKIPMTNMSLNQVQDLFKDIANMNKRHSPKSRYNRKRLKTNKFRRWKSLAEVSKRKKRDQNKQWIYVCFKESQDKSEMKAQKRKRQANVHDSNKVLNNPAISSNMTSGIFMLILNCSANLPRGNYLIKFLGDKEFEDVMMNTANNPSNIDYRNEAHGELDNELDVSELNLTPDKSAKTYNRTRRSSKWDKLKKWFYGDRVCSCKCRPHKTMCPACAASDAVMTEVIFRLTNIVNYVNDHNAELEQYCLSNPEGAAKFKDAVKQADKCLKDYSKRTKGQCHGKLCEAFKFIPDRKPDDEIAR